MLDRDARIAPERLADALDPERAIATRTVTGGAAPAPMDAMLDAAARRDGAARDAAATSAGPRSRPPSGALMRAQVAVG